MRYLILGLGIYGSNLARDLTDMGHEIIGVDQTQSNIDAIKDYISTVYMIDVTDEASLAMLPLNNVDLVIVAIGENFGASIKVVALLKKMKVKHIYARSIDKLHESILKGFEIDRILIPEQRAARDLTFEMGLGATVTSMTIDEDTYVLKFAAPKHFVDLKYVDLDMKHTYKLTLVSATRPVAKRDLLGITRRDPQCIDISDPDLVVEEGDVMVCMGTKKAFYNMFRQINS